MNKKNIRWSKSRMIAIGVSLLVAALVMTVSYLVFYRVEHKISTDGGAVVVGVLYCKSEEPIGSFFNSYGANNRLHEIKVTFDNYGADKISYSYYGSYDSNASAEAASARMHADYNISLGKSGVNPESLYPTFSPVKNEMRINLYADEKSLNSATAEFFFLDKNESIKFYEYTSDDFLKIYAAKGFSCDYNK